MPQQMQCIADLNGQAEAAWQSWCALLPPCWLADPAARPSIADLHGDLLMLYATQQRTLPALRDVGALVDETAK